MKLIKKIILSFLSAILFVSSFMLVSYADFPPPWDYCRIQSFEDWIYTGADEKNEFGGRSVENYTNYYIPACYVLGVDPKSFYYDRVLYSLETYWYDLDGVCYSEPGEYNRFEFLLRYSDNNERKANSNVTIILIKDEKENINLMDFEESPPAYEGNVSGFKSPNGKYLRKYKDIDVYYLISKDYQKSMRFWIDGYFFSITVTWGSDEETFYDSYEEFMTSEKTENLAALFSDDKDVFEYAMANIVLNVQNSENYVYGQPRQTVAITDDEDKKTSGKNCSNFSVITTLISLSVLSITVVLFKRKNH